MRMLEVPRLELRMRLGHERNGIRAEHLHDACDAVVQSPRGNEVHKHMAARAQAHQDKAFRGGQRTHMVPQRLDVGIQMRGRRVWHTLMRRTAHGLTRQRRQCTQVQYGVVARRGPSYEGIGCVRDIRGTARVLVQGA